jgi:hypothetical protein
LWQGTTCPALIEHNDVIAAGVEIAPMQGGTPTAWTAMKEYYRDSVTTTALFDVKYVTVTHRKTVYLKGFDLWIQCHDAL